MALCQCGCGKESGTYIFTRRQDNQIEGQPRRFLHGHYKREPFEQRFWGKTDKNGPIPSFRPELGPCWIWIGAIDSRGYGSSGTPGQKGSRGAHVISYEFSFGQVPQGLELDHLCRIRLCVNPSHLEAVTHRINVLRGATIPAANIHRTHCPRGHLLKGRNLEKCRLPSRICRICLRSREREIRAYEKEKDLRRSIKAAKAKKRQPI